MGFLFGRKRNKKIAKEVATAASSVTTDDLETRPTPVPDDDSLPKTPPRKPDTGSKRLRRRRVPSKQTPPRAKFITPLRTIDEAQDEGLHPDTGGTKDSDTTLLHFVNIVAMADSDSLDESFEVVTSGSSADSSRDFDTTLSSESTTTLDELCGILPAWEGARKKRMAKGDDVDAARAVQVEDLKAVKTMVVEDTDEQETAVELSLDGTQSETESEDHSGVASGSLLKEKEQAEEEKEERIEDEEHSEAEKQGTEVQEPDTAPEEVEEPPFDEEAEYNGAEDPTIDDITRTQTEAKTEAAASDPVARKLLDAFNCTDDTTTEGQQNKSGVISGLDMVMNSVCGTGVDQTKKRKYYDPKHTVQFLRDAVTKGILLLLHQPPTDGEEEWTGRSVHMFIRLGTYRGSHILQPQLEWSTLGGGWSRTGTVEVVTTSVDLLDVHSVEDFVEQEELANFGVAEEDMCFFTVTTNNGEVSMFEAASPEDRDRIVCGLRSVVARLAYHLIAGDSTFSSELYGEDHNELSGELPSLRTPAQAMSEISHAFLD